MFVINIRRLHGLHSPSVTRLSGGEMAADPVIENTWLHIRDGQVEGFGAMADFNAATCREEITDARGGDVLPAFCDSHTHIIYAGSREGEFRDKIAGLSYEEIAARGGGILNSADRLADTSEDELFNQSLTRAREIISKGTGAFEVKTGYGLTTDAELKMLRVAARLRETVPAQVKITFLGAHAVGRRYAGRQAEYVQMLIDGMLPAIAAEGIADYVDVFCDKGFFTVDEMNRILDAAARYGLRPKVHTDELAAIGATEAAVSRNAVSVDHLERLETSGIEALRGSQTIATMLPGASFFLGMPYGPARKAIESGLALALASDYNPGSSPSGDMRMVWALGCIRMRLTPEEALNAVTVNGAAAMGLGHSHGTLACGRAANFIITNPVPSTAFIPYAYTTPWIADIFLNGKPL